VKHYRIPLDVTRDIARSVRYISAYPWEVNRLIAHRGRRSIVV